jgi:hypothetical protein
MKAARPRRSDFSGAAPDLDGEERRATREDEVDLAIADPPPGHLDVRAGGRDEVRADGRLDESPAERAVGPSILGAPASFYSEW